MIHSTQPILLPLDTKAHCMLCAFHQLSTLAEHFTTKSRNMIHRDVVEVRSRCLTHPHPVIGHAELSHGCPQVPPLSYQHALGKATSMKPSPMQLESIASGQLEGEYALYPQNKSIERSATLNQEECRPIPPGCIRASISLRSTSLQSAETTLSGQRCFYPL